MGRVARYEELQLPLKVASVEVHIPRSESCDGRGMKKLSIPWGIHNMRNSKFQSFHRLIFNTLLNSLGKNRKWDFISLHQDKTHRSLFFFYCGMTLKSFLTAEHSLFRQMLPHSWLEFCNQPDRISREKMNVICSNNMTALWTSGEHVQYVTHSWGWRFESGLRPSYVDLTVHVFPIRYLPPLGSLACQDVPSDRLSWLAVTSQNNTG